LIGYCIDIINYYNKVLEIYPRDADAWSSMGNALKKLGRTEEAEICFNEVSRIASLIRLRYKNGIMEIYSEDKWSYYYGGKKIE